MGKRFRLHCRECGFEYFANVGTGYYFLRSVEGALWQGRNGYLGPEVKQFLQDHPEGLLDSEGVLVQCTACDIPELRSDLSMCLPVEKPMKKEIEWLIRVGMEDESEELTPEDLKAFRRVGSYRHICRYCGGPMKVRREEELEKLCGQRIGKEETEGIPCPYCKKDMEVFYEREWD